MKGLVFAILMLGGALAPGQPAEPPREPTALEQATQQLLRLMRDKDSSEVAHTTILNLPRVYARNGWTSEPDQFSLDLIREADALPPWQVEQQFNVLTGRLADRYLLDERQQGVLHDLLEREANTFIGQHVGQLIPVFVEALQTRLAREPYTPEQVARWTDATTPVVADARRRLQAASAEFMGVLDPQQRELVQTDLDAANRRIDRVQELRETWRRGEWDSADWGLEEDPIQRGAVPTGRPPQEQQGQSGTRSDTPAAAESDPGPGAAGRRSPRPTTSPTEDGDPWARYVRDFIRQYGLDEAQQQRAWIIFRSARERRDFHEQRYGQRIAQCRRELAASGGESLQHRLGELEKTQATMREMIFEEMKRRLERLPTRAQRRTAAENGEQKTIEPPVRTELSGP
jgi:phage gp37-like protein